MSLGSKETFKLSMMNELKEKHSALRYLLRAKFRKFYYKPYDLVFEIIGTEEGDFIITFYDFSSSGMNLDDIDLDISDNNELTKVDYIVEHLNAFQDNVYYSTIHYYLYLDKQKLEMAELKSVDNASLRTVDIRSVEKVDANTYLDRREAIRKDSKYFFIDFVPTQKFFDKLHASGPRSKKSGPIRKEMRDVIARAQQNKETSFAIALMRELERLGVEFY